jgi:hypothetical protein
MTLDASSAGAYVGQPYNFRISALYWVRRSKIILPTQGAYNESIMDTDPNQTVASLRLWQGACLSNTTQRIKHL